MKSTTLRYSVFDIRNSIFIVLLFLLPWTSSYGGEVTWKGDQAVEGNMKATGSITAEDGIILRQSIEGSDEGLVLHFDFDSDEGGVVSDLSAEGNNGIVNGAQWTAQGALGSAGCYYFGGDDLIEVPDSDSLDIQGTELTISAWVHPTEFEGDVHRPVVSKWANDYYGPVRTWYLRLRDGIPSAAWSWNGEGWNSQLSNYRALEGSMALLLSQWTHVVVTLKSGNASIYINGQLDASSPDGSFPEGFYNSQRPVFIGAGDMSAGNDPIRRYFKGYIDEVRVYDRALPQEEVEFLYLGAIGEREVEIRAGDVDRWNDPVKAIKGKDLEQKKVKAEILELTGRGNDPGGWIKSGSTDSYVALRATPNDYAGANESGLLGVFGKDYSGSPDWQGDVHAWGGTEQGKFRVFTGPSSEERLTVDEEGNVDLHGGRIINTAEPTEPEDLISMQYLDDLLNNYARTDGDNMFWGWQEIIGDLNVQGRIDTGDMDVYGWLTARDITVDFLSAGGADINGLLNVGDLDVGNNLTVNGEAVPTAADLENVARTDQDNEFCGYQQINGDVYIDGGLVLNGTIEVQQGGDLDMGDYQQQ